MSGKTPVVVVVSLMVGCLAAGNAAAQLVAAGPVAEPLQSNPRAPGDPVSLVLDDGTRENALGLTSGGQFIWLNRFTPTEYPIALGTVDVLFGAGVGINVGELFDVYLYADTDGDGDPGTGAAYIGGSTGNAVAAADDVTWTTVTLSPALDFPGPGDVIVAVVNRTAGTDPGEFPAAMDQTASQGRSWIGIYSANPGDPPTLPADVNWGIADSFGFAGNWMIRAGGTVTPVELISLTVD